MGVYRGYDQAGLDAQYDARAAHPEHLEFFSRWAAASAAARAAHRPDRDVPYGDHPRERLDLFPAAAAGAPVLVFIHGGYWRSLDKDDFSFLAPPWLAAGAAFVAVRYPLAPAAHLAQIVESCRRALAWVRRNARALGGDPERLFVAGHSAGAHLAAALASATGQDAGDPPPVPVRGALCVSGIYDLEPVRLSYLNATLALDPDAARLFSPVHQPAGRAPLLLAVGAAESDEFRRQRDAFAAVRRRAGQAVTTLDLAGCHHFSVVDALADPHGALHRRFARWLFADGGA